MLPHWLDRSIRAVGVTTDALLAGAGVAALILTPHSIDITTGDHTVATIWALMLLAGGVVAGVFALARNVVVAGAGILLEAGGMVTWGIAAVTQPAATATSVATACAFAALATALLWRIFGLLAGLHLRRTRVANQQGRA